MRADRLGGSSVKSPGEPGPELSGRELGGMRKVPNLGSLRSSSPSISGKGPPRLGAGWGSLTSRGKTCLPTGPDAAGSLRGGVTGVC